MTIFVYTNGAPSPVVSGVLGQDESAESPTHLFNLHYRMKQSLAAGEVSPISITEVVADDLNLVSLNTSVEGGLVITGDDTVCP